MQLVEMDLDDLLKFHNMQVGDRKDDGQSCGEPHAATPPQRLSGGDRNKELKSMEAPADGSMTVLQPDTPLRDDASASSRRGEDIKVEVVDCGVNPIDDGLVLGGDRNKKLKLMEALTDGTMTVLQPDTPLRDVSAN